MKAIVYGAGAREHALAARLVTEGWSTTVAPGNAGIARHLTCHPLDLTDLAAAVGLARTLSVDLAVIGPEAPLVAGLADALRAAGIVTFGPSAAAARVEGSKAFAKSLMVVAGVPTAGYQVFDEGAQAQAQAYARSFGGRVAVKADGIAAGKGVVVAGSVAEADAAVVTLLEQRPDGRPGARLVIEERLEGPEVSLMALCHGLDANPLPLAHDYKRLRDGDLGPNTGGMGAVAPSERARDLEALTDLAIRPVLAELVRRGTPFSGLLYAGLILTGDGPKVLEYNCRFGDPETQALLWATGGPLGEGLLAVARGSSAKTLLRPTGEVAVAVVLAAAGYPEAPRSGTVIEGLPEAEQRCAAVYAAGVGTLGDALVVAGGRVVTCVGVGASTQGASDQAYDAASRLRFDGKQLRRDVGLK